MGEKREEKKNKAMKHLSTPYRGKVRVEAGRKRGEIKNRGVQNIMENNFVSKNLLFIQQHLSVALQYLCLDNVHLSTCLLDNTLFYSKNIISLAFFFTVCPLLPVKSGKWRKA